MFEIMKRYTLRALIHDAKVFNQLRLEYRRTNENRCKDSFSGWLSRYLAGMRRRAQASNNAVLALCATTSSDTSPNQLFVDLDRPGQSVLVRTMKRNFLTLAAAGLIVLGGFALVQAQGPRGGGRGHAVEQLTEGLNLTPDQQAKVQPIIDQAKPKIAEIHREAMQKMKAVMADTASQIRPLLTPEQQKKLDENENARRGRMNARKGPRDETED
jgi:Spy/CpxP family protein refolding chaperone